MIIWTKFSENFVIPFRGNITQFYSGRAPILKMVANLAAAYRQGLSVALDIPILVLVITSSISSPRCIEIPEVS